MKTHRPISQLQLLRTGLLAALTLLAATLASAAPPRLNVLVLLADDQRFDTMHALGNDEVRTPQLDRLTREGFAFTHAFIMGSGQPAVCVPSRAMLMTGRSLFRATARFTNGLIPRVASTLPSTLREAGYATYLVGKWHNDKPSLVRSFTGGGPIFFGGMTDHARIPVQPFDSSGVYAPTNERIATRFSSGLFADAAIDILRRHSGARPFFLYVAFTAPHDPRTPPKETAELYPPDKIRLPENFLAEHPFDNGELKIRDEKLLPWPRTPEAVRKEIAAYYGMVTHLDGQIGRILRVLEETGRNRDTLVVFAGDNGLAVGQHGLLGKQNLYEHSIRVPLVLRGPGIPRGARSDALVYLFDLFPTVCGLAGVTVPATVEGKSLEPILRGRQQRVRESVFAAYRDVQRMVRDDRWKLIWYPKIERYQLFDLKRDPLEMRDLSGDRRQAARLAALKGNLAEMQARWDDPGPFR